MRRRFSIVVLLAIGLVSVVAPSGASAATEFGDNCIGNEGLNSPITLFEISATGNPLPPAAPSAGVITKWKVNLVPAPVTIPVTMKVLRPTGPTTALVVGEASGNITGGANSFDTRIPVAAGDHLSSFSASEIGTIICEDPTEAPAVLGGFEGSGGSPGSNVNYVTVPAPGIRIPLYATLEPDADGDGFGDETQDACPQSNAAQVACPVVKLSLSATAKKKSVTIAVTGTAAANVTVNGKVSLGKGKKAKLKAGTKAVAPGAFTKFTLKFPAKLTKRLKELPPSKKLTLKVTTSAPNIAAAPTKKTINVKLKGQG
jgi:hypothetical protein